MQAHWGSCEVGRAWRPPGQQPVRARARRVIVFVPTSHHVMTMPPPVLALPALAAGAVRERELGGDEEAVEPLLGAGPGVVGHDAWEVEAHG